MKKNEIRSYVVLAIFFTVFTVITFAVPFERTGIFWFGYICGVIAIAFQIYILKISFFGEGDAKSKFYGFPIARIGLIYLSVQIAVSFLEMAIGKYIPFWTVLVVNVIIIALAVTGSTATDAMREEIARQDIKLKKNVDNMRNLQSLAASLESQCSDESIKKSLSKMAEEFRFSDPVSSESTSDLEEDLLVQLKDVQKAVVDGDIGAIAKLCEGVISTLRERNRLCAINK
ncbi:MAG: hypothetical protein HFI47_12245 [Lachnospiraceae bacterium]|nr:hypothetical protein [Lachnospiraceae bacterium]